MKVLDLFSGIGGFSLGLENAGMETIAFCEIEEFPRKVLNKHWPSIPCASDVTKLTYKDGVLYDDGQEIYRGSVDVVCGGFPCQDLSTAGKQQGISAERSGLFYEMCRVISECRPGFAIFENVTNLLNGGGGDWFTEVLCEISALGYDAEWHCIPASELGAHHHRDRIWIMAYPHETFEEGGWLSSRVQKEIAIAYGRSNHWCARHNVASPLSWGQQGQGQPEQSLDPEAIENWEAAKPVNGCIGGIWQAEPGVGRVVDGIWKRIYGHRLGALGNSVVPQIPEIIGRAIMSIE